MAVLREASPKSPCPPRQTVPADAQDLARSGNPRPRVTRASHAISREKNSFSLLEDEGPTYESAGGRISSANINPSGPTETGAPNPDYGTRVGEDVGTRYFIHSFHEEWKGMREGKRMIRIHWS